MKKPTNPAYQEIKRAMEQTPIDPIEAIVEQANNQLAPEGHWASPCELGPACARLAYAEGLRRGVTLCDIVYERTDEENGGCNDPDFWCGILACRREIRAELAKYDPTPAPAPPPTMKETP